MRLPDMLRPLWTASTGRDSTIHIMSLIPPQQKLLQPHVPLILTLLCYHVLPAIPSGSRQGTGALDGDTLPRADIPHYRSSF
jgi:hypothetical protein